MIKYLGIDPSYSRTGCAIEINGAPSYASFEHKGDNYNILQCFEHAQALAKDIKEFISKYVEADDDLVIAVEYPVMASRSGAYLAMIHPKLDSLFRTIKSKYHSVTAYYFPPTAISSLSGVRRTDKTKLVDYARKTYGVAKRVNHDEVSAFCLIKLAQAVMNKTYKHTSFVKVYSEHSWESSTKPK